MPSTTTEQPISFRTIYPPETAARRKWLIEQIDTLAVRLIRELEGNGFIKPSYYQIQQARLRYDTETKPYHDELLQIEMKQAYPIEVIL